MKRELREEEFSFVPRSGPRIQNCGMLAIWNEDMDVPVYAKLFGYPCNNPLALTMGPETLEIFTFVFMQICMRCLPCLVQLNKSQWCTLIWPSDCTASAIIFFVSNYMHRSFL